MLRGLNWSEKPLASLNATGSALAIMHPEGLVESLRMQHHLFKQISKGRRPSVSFLFQRYRTLWVPKCMLRKFDVPVLIHVCSFVKPSLMLLKVFLTKASHIHVAPAAQAERRRSRALEAQTVAGLMTKHRRNATVSLGLWIA